MNFETLIGHIAGRVAQGMRPDDVVTKRYMAVLTKLAEHALTKWSASSAAGIRCAVELRRKRTGVRERCGQPAAGSCVVCGKATCIDHAMVSVKDGSLMCEGCVVAVASTYASAGPQAAAEQSRERDVSIGHLSTLGLPEGATLEQIKSAYRELAKRHHPDRKSGDAKKRAEQRLKEINEAYSWLSRQYGREAAA